MDAFLASMVILGLSAGGALLVGKNGRLATAIGAGGAILAAILGLISAISSLVTGETYAWKADLHIPYASLSLGIDPLSGFFLFAIFFIVGLSALYGSEYLMGYKDKKNLGVAWFHFNVLFGSMALVVTARNGVLFIIAWELMAISSYFLVTFESEKKKTLDAGFAYLISIILGTVCILALFILLGGGGDSLDFDKFVEAKGGLATAIFLLAVIGFGFKAGFVPAQPWLPDAHAIAPIHVHAVMSGVMIKMGIYGLLRVLTFTGMPPAWWGYFIIILGVITGVFGVLFALGQHNIKRLLAYHSVENIGIIIIGIGFGLLGVALEIPVMAVLGFGGGILHVLNHGLFKALLMLSMGGIVKSTGTTTMDELGGAYKKMPVCGTMFLVGAVAISGLPPLNGFISEFLIYFGSYHSIIAEGASGGTIAIACFAIAGLALIGGLCAACFIKAFGSMFLGEPRTEVAHKAHDPGFRMCFVMVAIGLACFAIGLGAPLVIPLLAGPMAPLLVFSGANAPAILASAADSLQMVVIGSVIFIVLIGVIAFFRLSLLKGRAFEQTGTWDCGYAAPYARMQYTSSSFASPIVDFFNVVLRSKKKIKQPTGLFPQPTSFHCDTAEQCLDETPDVFVRIFWRPVILAVDWVAVKLRPLQGTQTNIAVLYISLAFIVLLILNFGL